MNEATKTVRWIKGIAALVVTTWVFLAVLPLFAQTFGSNYLPSTDWMETTKSYGLALGLIMAVAVFVFAIKKIDTNKGELRKIGAILVAPFMGYFLGSTPITVGVPMIASIVAGHHIELPYEVVRADAPSNRGCSRPIELQGLPFMVNSLCGYSDDVRRNLNPHMRIMVEGRGTSMGVHVATFHLIK
ncbi:hypothetical protein [Phyllobacterium sp.]|uniref:hypothetical protein n=1 Tax=unclassified Phyllobacterium TaxID=2638441 RepID=UPI0031FC8E55|nr:hypothetical protein [Phyllobacterium sp.]